MSSSEVSSKSNNYFLPEEEELRVFLLEVIYGELEHGEVMVELCTNVEHLWV